MTSEPGEPVPSTPDGHTTDRPDGLPPLREVIAAFGLDARKSLGQNFILDLNLTRRIARAAGSLQDRVAIEVGPGPGGLTRGLLMEGAARVIAVERDDRCLPALQAIADAYPGRLEVVADDALEVDWKGLLRPGESAVIAANLPYNIATRLLIQWLETEPWPPWWHRMALMFQREVAERIVAAPETKAYGRLAVIAQWRTRPASPCVLAQKPSRHRQKLHLPWWSLSPARAANPPAVCLTLGRVTGAAFGQRRKMLRQSLKLLGRDPAALLAAAGVAPERRAEELSPADFARIAQAVDAGVGRLDNR